MPTPGSASRRWVSPRCSPSPWTPRCCSPRCARPWRRSRSNPVAPIRPTITYRDVTVDPGAASAVSLLVVDDDPVARAQLSALLRAAGYEVRRAEHGREAWDTLQVARIPGVICDWYMPEMDGPELCRRIRARRDQPYVYFILITSRGGREQYLAGMRAGADHFLPKPVGRGQLGARRTGPGGLPGLRPKTQKPEGLLPTWRN